VRRLGVLDLRSPDSASIRTRLIRELRDGGFDIAAVLDPTPVASFPIAAVLMFVDVSGADAMEVWVRALVGRSVTVAVVFDERSPELRLRAAIEGAVACLPSRADGRTIAAAVSAALAEDAPSFGEQRRRTRVAALEALVRAGGGRAPDRARVHLTRLEHGRVREEPPAPAAPFAACTDKQRELLSIVAREGSVGRAAIVTGQSRSALYSNLRRIAHRLHLRDSGELLRLLGASASDPPVRAV
jgi:DNA-binding NarL/FixJ family response regulator